jgi:hypothetical protein
VTGVLITIDATTDLTRDRLALIMADEFDEHGYVEAVSVTIHRDGEKAVTYILAPDLPEAGAWVAEHFDVSPFSWRDADGVMHGPSFDPPAPDLPEGTP